MAEQAADIRNYKNTSITRLYERLAKAKVIQKQLLLLHPNC
jgi:hypothetical protein